MAMAQTPMGARRASLGFSALEFARLLQPHFPFMTEGRLFRLESGRAKATPQERETISRLLGVKAWEVFL